jgi:hypothetical protein
MEHTADITKMLQGLVAKGLLAKSNYGRWTTYRLAIEIPQNSPHSDGNSPHSIKKRLLKIVAPVREQKRLPQKKIQEIIRNLCQVCPLTVVQIAELLQRDPEKIRDRHINPMVKKGELQPRFSEPNHPQQAYTTNSERLNSDR